MCTYELIFGYTQLCRPYSVLFTVRCVTLMSFLILELNRLMAALDTAADKALSSSEAVTPVRQKRVTSDVPSSLVLPTDSPEWAIKSDSNCRTNGNGIGQHIATLFCVQNSSKYVCVHAHR